jgi:hypothetical protein
MRIGWALYSARGARNRVRKDVSGQCNDVVKSVWFLDCLMDRSSAPESMKVFIYSDDTPVWRNVV